MTLAEYVQATELGAVVGCGCPVPTSAQWAAVRYDLECEPQGGRWWRYRRWGLSVVLVNGPITLHPAYAFSPHVARYKGHANPVPVVNTRDAYPDGGGRSGVSVALHECGHALCEVLTTAAWDIKLRTIPMYHRPEYRAVQVAMAGRRFERQANDAEYWAQDYACYCRWNARRDEELWWFRTPDYRPVRDYFRAVTAQAGWVYDLRPETDEV